MTIGWGVLFKQDNWLGSAVKTRQLARECCSNKTIGWGVLFKQDNWLCYETEHGNNLNIVISSIIFFFAWHCEHAELINHIKRDILVNKHKLSIDRFLELDYEHS